jgi:hypothetical protein
VAVISRSSVADDLLSATEPQLALAPPLLEPLLLLTALSPLTSLCISLCKGLRGIGPKPGSPVAKCSSGLMEPGPNSSFPLETYGSAAGSGTSVGVEFTLTVGVPLAEVAVFLLRARFRIVCIDTLRSSGGTRSPMSTFSTSDTLCSQVDVGLMDVGRVKVAVTMYDIVPLSNCKEMVSELQPSFMAYDTGDINLRRYCLEALWRGRRGRIRTRTGRA